MIKCKIHSSFNYTAIEQMVMQFYEEYEIVDVKFSTTLDAPYNCVNYSVMIVYKEK